MYSKKLGILLVGGVILCVAIYASILIWITWPITEVSINKSGVFGDSFGLLTSLFSGLAFAGLIITILMQKEELGLQREELSLTRSELSGQKEELKIQNQTMVQQQFENTSFQMLSLHNEIVKGMDVKLGNAEFSGRDAFQGIHHRLMKSKVGKELQSAGLESLNTLYMQFYRQTQNEIGHYFRNLYNIIKFVDMSTIENKKLYTNIVRAQLSSFELFFVFYNCLSEMGVEKFKPLIEKFGLLKTLSDDLLCNKETHKGFYNGSAYGSA